MSVAVIVDVLRGRYSVVVTVKIVQGAILCSAWIVSVVAAVDIILAAFMKFAQHIDR